MRFYIGVLLTLGLIIPAGAQEIDPRFPIAGKSAFGVAGLYSPDAVLPNPVGANPATQNVVLNYSYPPSIEVDWGQLATRSDFRVNFSILNYFQNVGKKGTVRISGYKTTSNKGNIPLITPLKGEHNGDAVELVYAHRVGDNMDVGVAIVPRDKMETNLYLGDQKIASGDAHSTFQWRAGAAYRLKQFRFGGVFSNESIKTNAQLGSNVKGNFTQNVWVLGVAWEPQLGSSVFYNRQDLKLKGEGLNESRPLSYWGLQQFLSKQWMLRLSRVGSGDSIAVGYLDKEWEAYVSFTERAFATSEDVYGRTSLVFITAVKKF